MSITRSAITPMGYGPQYSPLLNLRRVAVTPGDLQKQKRTEIYTPLSFNHIETQPIVSKAEALRELCYDTNLVDSLSKNQTQPIMVVAKTERKTGGKKTISAEARRARMMYARTFLGKKKNKSGGGMLDTSAISGGSSYDKAALKGGSSYDKAALKGGSSYDKAALKGGSSYDKAALKGGSSYDKAALKGGSSYDKAALKGGKSYNKAALKGGRSYDKAALKGGKSYNKAAIKGGAFLDRYIDWILDEPGNNAQDNAVAANVAPANAAQVGAAQAQANANAAQVNNVQANAAAAQLLNNPATRNQIKSLKDALRTGSQKQIVNTLSSISPALVHLMGGNPTLGLILLGVQGITWLHNYLSDKRAAAAQKDRELFAAQLAASNEIRNAFKK